MRPLFIYASLVAVGATAFAFWMRRAERKLRQEVCISADKIEVKIGKATEELYWSEILKVNYAYTAITFCAARWDLVAKDGKILSIDEDAIGKDELVKGFERNLPGFSAEAVKRQVKESPFDEDNIEVWVSA